MKEQQEMMTRLDRCRALRGSLLGGGLAMLILLGTACEGDGPIENAAEDVDDAVGDAADEVGDAVDDIGD